MAKVLYITYDGLMEPLGRSQVFQYLKNLAASHEITLISYEKPADLPDASARAELRALMREHGIRWIPLRYHRKPSSVATSYDICAGLLLSSFLVLRHGIRIVHARSYVPSVIALALKKLLGVRFIFDMRGFWADERVERAGLPRTSPLYRAAKWFERHFFSQADFVVSLTHAGVSAIAGFPYLRERPPRCRVIPTCTDLASFRLMPGREERFTLGYVGSADTAYMFEPVLRCFASLRAVRKDARLLVLTRTPHRYVQGLLRQHGIEDAAVEIRSVTPDQVPGEMARMHAGIFFVKPGFSTCASVPTKLGEFLACGVPCLGNAGVGDMESILEGEGVGVILRDFSPEAESAAVARLLELASDDGVRGRCSEVAERFFSLEQGVRSYHDIYRSLEGA